MCAPTLAPELEALLERAVFSNPAAARARLGDLAGDPLEMLGLAKLSPELGEALVGAADPDLALTNFDRFVQAHGARLALYHQLAARPATLDALVHLVGASCFLSDILVRNPEYLALLGDPAWLGAPADPRVSEGELARTCEAFPSRAGRLDAARRTLRREILRIGAADLLGIAGFRRTVAELSALADTIVRQCLEIVSAGEAAGAITVLALGKLGGAELNYSSDIDLVFVTRESQPSEEAVRLARDLTEALRAFSDEGFLYRVDLRLRPYGRTGALVVSSEVFAQYLSARADPAERQAMLKARPIAGDREEGRRLLERLEPIVFGLGGRGDPRAAVRGLKLRIEKQLRRQGRAEGHVKLAPGGIRDIEFIVQALQLEMGGARPELRSANTLDGLERLARAGIVSGDDADDLAESYVFLRTIEHRLQLMNNQQVHELPRGGRDLKALARSVGFREGDEAGRLREAVDGHARRVRAIFDRLLPEMGQG